VDLVYFVFFNKFESRAWVAMALHFALSYLSGAQRLMSPDWQ
jgi:hypothetical protein